MYLLDTNIISDVIRNPRGASRLRMAQIGDRIIATSIIVAGELRFGLERNRSQRLVSRIDDIFRTVPVLPLGDDADIHYGRLRADLERRGLPISGNDMLIAAHALSLGATLVTANVREFERVDGLAIENWLCAT